MSSKSIHYRKEIDGLRALAVLPVIFFHAGVPFFSGGFIGVDVFFVISGYLITNILLAETQSTGRISIAGFYERRVRRLAPALIFMLLITSIFAGIILWPALLIEYSVNALASSFFLSNFSLWFQGGYFGGSSETNALLHTWSLAVEEQFYIVFPLLVLAAWRVGRGSGVLALIVIASLVSLVLAQLGTIYAVTANYYLPHSRAWELGIGALAAAIWSRGALVSQSWRELLSWSGLGLIILSVFIINEKTPFPGVWALPPTLGTALLLISAGPETLVGRILNLRFFVFFGLMSYSLYLWHQPFLALYRVYADDRASSLGMGLVVLASVLMGYISWRYIEGPFRRQEFLTRSRVFLVAAFGFSVVAAISLFFLSTKGLVGRFPEHLHEMLGVSAAERGEYVQQAYNSEIRDREYQDGLPRLFIIGDSFSQDFYNMMRESGMVSGWQISADYIAARCQLRPNGVAPEGTIEPGDVQRCNSKDNKISEQTIQLAQSADVIVIAFYWRGWAIEMLPEALRSLKIKPEARVVLLGSKGFSKLDIKSIKNLSLDELRELRKPLDFEALQVNKSLGSLDINADFVDVMDLICNPDNFCYQFTPEGMAISHDGRHLTRDGARYIGEILFSEFGPMAFLRVAK